MTGTFFAPEDTSPRIVKWLQPGDGPAGGGFLIAALPGGHPALILFGVADELMTPTAIAALCRLACTSGAPRNELRAIYVYHGGGGRNAPVTRVSAINTSNYWTINGFIHPEIAEEEWVIEQAHLAGLH